MVYDHLQDLTGRKINSFTAKDTFIENYNVLKRKKAEVQLEAAELEKNILIEKLRAEKDHNISQAKQDRLKKERRNFGARVKKN